MSGISSDICIGFESVLYKKRHYIAVLLLTCDFECQIIAAQWHTFH